MEGGIHLSEAEDSTEETQLEAATARVRDRWSLRLTAEERAAGDRLLRLRRDRAQSVGATLLALLYLVLRFLWHLHAREANNGRPVMQAFDEQGSQLVSLALIAVALGAAALVSVLRIRRYVSALETQEIRSAEINAYADEAALAPDYEESWSKAEVERDDAEWAEALRSASPWWRRELSGAHLVWWIALATLGGQQLRLLVLPQAVADAVMVCVGFGAVVKVFITAMMLIPTYRMAVRYYRWWGRGWEPVALALLPAVLAYLAGGEGP